MMSVRSGLRFSFSAILCLVLVAGRPAAPSMASDPQPDRREEFLRLCDIHRKVVDKQAAATKREGRAFYWDSYVVRALCVAYDLTGKEEYLDTCRRWCDRMMEYQGQMIPKGAYYMQYGRSPGEKEGNWYTADCSSIALALLATAVRCEDPTEKAKYLDSVKSFVRLVADRFVRPSGGVTDGYWPKSDKEWWCSTGIFASLVFCMYNETGDESYLKLGLGAIDWLNQQDLLRVAVHFPPEKIKPTVMMYCLEAYSPGFPHLEPGSKRYNQATAQWNVALEWMKRDFGGQGGRDCTDQWGSKMGGLPFHLYVRAGQVPHADELVKMADRELDYATGVMKESSVDSHRDQLATFLLMSYAEKVAPGKIYRTSR